MKLHITKEWFSRRVDLEGDANIGAGVPVPEEMQEEASQSAPALDETRLALGTLVELTRRKQAMSIEKLAQEARVDLAEVVSIERDASFRPEPRTLYQIAGVLGLPSRGLLQLSGNVRVRDEQLRHQAVRFAARSGSVEKLSTEERKALEEFVAFLNQQK